METTQTTTGQNPLENYKQKAISAHNWTSFSPERRGEQMIKEYGQELTQDLQELREKGITEEIVLDYETRYKKFFSSYLGAKSNTFSAMITGPARFNNRKHEKANRSKHRHYEIFREWRERAKKAIVRKAQPAKTFVSEIERYKAELEGMKRNHELMKNCNAIIKKSKGTDCTSLLVEAGLSESNAKKIQLPDFANRIGFASFSLTNNNANIKRVEERIKTLEAKEQRATTVGQESLQFNGGVIIYNHEADRIQIKHDTKPQPEIISLLKSNGFKWSPSQSVWQRQLTENARLALKHYIYPKLTATVI
jgi:hypothetical protein